MKLLTKIRYAMALPIFRLVIMLCSWICKASDFVIKKSTKTKENAESFVEEILEQLN